MEANEGFGMAILSGVGIMLIAATSHWIIGALLIAASINAFIGNTPDIGNEILNP